MAPPKTTKKAPKPPAKSTVKKITKSTIGRARKGATEAASNASLAPKTRLGDLLSSRSANSPYLPLAKRQNAIPKMISSKTKTPSTSISDDLEPISIGSASNSILLTTPTSYAARKRRHATLSRAEILAASRKADSDNESIGEPIDHAATFASNSLAHFTWGSPSTKPVIAVGKRRQKRGLRASGSRGKGRQSANDIFMFGKRSKEDRLIQTTEGIDSSKCYLLQKLPLELRWKIYGNILIHEKPIPVHHDWHYVHIHGPLNHALLYVNNKQIMEETHNFLYRENVFRALVKEQPALNSRFDNRMFIAKTYLPLFKNVILELRQENFGLEWIKTVAASIKKLVTCRAILDSLTMVITPERVGMTEGLLGVEIAPVTFADFFFTGPVSVAAPSDIMMALAMLRFKVLHIILRLPDKLLLPGKGKKRALISVDMRALPVNQVTNGWLSREQTNLEARRERTWELSEELRGLKARVEDLVGDAETAVAKGKARWLREGEGVGGGLRL